MIVYSTLTLCDTKIGSVSYSLVSELFSSRLRQKTVVIARSIDNFGGIVNTFLALNMLNSSSWNWDANLGFPWTGICFTCILWCNFRLPEPNNRS